MESSLVTEFVAGGFAGMAGVICGQPLDTLRVRLQQPAAARPNLSAPMACAAAGSCGGGTSAIGLLQSVVASEGPAALYRGMAAPLASVALQNAVVFQLHATLSRAFESKNANDHQQQHPSYKSVALAGVGTGALQSLTLSPIELVKIRLQLRTPDANPPGPFSMARDIIRNEGLRGMYRGLSVTALRDAPSLGAYFWSYEWAKRQLSPGRKNGEEGMGSVLLAGGFAGVCSWVCCYPMDVVKTRLQAQSAPLPGQPPLKYLGVVDCVRKSVREEGTCVLFRGLGTAVVRAFVVNGAIFGAYELVCGFLGSKS